MKFVSLFLLLRSVSLTFSETTLLDERQDKTRDKQHVHTITNETKTTNDKQPSRTITVSVAHVFVHSAFRFLSDHRVVSCRLLFAGFVGFVVFFRRCLHLLPQQCETATRFTPPMSRIQLTMPSDMVPFHLTSMLFTLPPPDVCVSAVSRWCRTLVSTFHCERVVVPTFLQLQQS